VPLHFTFCNEFDVRVATLGVDLKYRYKVMKLQFGFFFTWHSLLVIFFHFSFPMYSTMKVIEQLIFQSLIIWQKKGP
jgi:hypothetical protein